MAQTTFVAAAFLLLAMLCLVEESSAALYDRKRGFKTYNTPAADVDAYLKEHRPETIRARYANHEALKEHPEVARFLEWDKRQKAGDAGAAPAFAGKIPHDYLPHLHKSSTPPVQSQSVEL